MPKFVIERDFPGAGRLSTEELKGMAKKSCNVLREMGPEIQWLESFVNENKVYCVYVAPDEAAIRTHGAKGGFPVTRVSRISFVVDPTTAE
jgi:hypothetical protein